MWLHKKQKNWARWIHGSISKFINFFPSLKMLKKNTYTKKGYGKTNIATAN